MKKDTKLNNFITLLFCCFCLSTGKYNSAYANSDSLSPLEYGTLYVMEKKDREVLPWRAGFNYSYEFGNPYSDIHGTTITIEHSIGRYVWVGLQGTRFFSSPTPLMNILGNELQAQGIGNSIKTPIYSVYPIATLIPVSGHVSFFGTSPLEMELNVRIGVGYISYGNDISRTGLLWSIRPVVHINRNWSIQTAVGQEIESPLQSQDRLFHLRGELGVSYQF